MCVCKEIQTPKSEYGPPQHCNRRQKDRRCFGPKCGWLDSQRESGGLVVSASSNRAQDAWNDEREKVRGDGVN